MRFWQGMNTNRATRALRLRAARGFTLLEVLVVVAIIGVLIAIAIPVFSSQLEKSREAVDVANMRAARGLASAEYMTGNLEEGHEYYFTPAGTLSDVRPQGYGKGTADNSETTYETYDGGLDYTNSVICVRAEDSVVYVYWDVAGQYPEKTGITFGGSAETTRQWIEKSLAAFETFYGSVAEREYAAIFIDTWKQGNNYGGSNDFLRNSNELGRSDVPQYAFDVGEWGQRSYDVDGAFPTNANDPNSPRLYILIRNGQIYTNTIPETGEQVNGWVAWR